MIADWSPGAARRAIEAVLTARGVPVEYAAEVAAEIVLVLARGPVPGEVVVLDPPTAGRCKFCHLTIGDAPRFCAARTLIPGERFPHEREGDGDRMVRAIATDGARRRRFGGARKAR